MSDIERYRAEVQRLEAENRRLAGKGPDTSGEVKIAGGGMAALNERLRLLQAENARLKQK